MLVFTDESRQAVEYAQKHLVKLTQNQPELMQIVQSAMGFIAYPANLRPQLKAYRHMTGDCRWNELATQFEKESLDLYGLNEHFMFTHALQTGISVLKTVFCE
jgi:hypothetical protein